MSENPDSAYKNFLCEYGFEGARWCLTIKATSWDEARARLKAIGMGQVKGTDVVSIPVPGGMFLYRLWRWLRGGG